MDSSDHQTIRQLLDDYLRMYASRDIRIELEDVNLQSLAETIAVATAFFTIHLPIKDHILSRETARLVLVFRKESSGWKISHSSISIPYHLVREGEVYPLKELVERGQVLEQLVAERTSQLSEANAVLASENAEQGKGRKVTDFLVPEDRDRAMSRVALLFQGGISGPSEYRALRMDGTTFDIEVNSALIRDAEGRPTKLVVIARDITARKQVEAALQQAVAQINTLHGLLPICMHCKKIRDDRGHWSPVEVYVRERTGAEFSHGLCPHCLETRYPDVAPDEDEDTP